MRLLTALFAAAVAVSVVHYTDNYLNYDDYPVPESGPVPSRTVIGLAWFAFTAVGVAGYVAYARGRIRRGALLLALYSGSGLVGLGHYTVDMSGQPWWRHAHIVADIACGAAILAFAVWAARARRPVGA